MKKSKEQFAEAQRQSPYALLFIAGDSLKRLANLLWPLALVYFIGSSASMFNYYLVFIAILSIFFSLSVGVLNYLRYTYHVTGNKIIINQGIFRRSRTSVPFDRIQVVRIDEKIMHRWTNTRGLTIETAGNTAEELQIKALPYDDAAILQSILMPKERKQAHSEASIAEMPEERLVIKHSLWDTLRVGLTQNHFRSAWYIIVFVFVMFSQLYDIIGERLLDEVLDSYESLFAVNLIVGSAFLITVVLSSIIVSLALAFLQYFSLRVLYDGSHLKVRAGLFNRQEHTVKQERIQMYREETNPLRKLIDFTSIDIHQPVSSTEMAKKSISISGVRFADIDTFRSFALQETEFLFPIDIKSEKVVIFRRFLYLALVPVLVFIPIGWYYIGWESVFSLLLLPFIYLLIRIWYRKLALNVSENHIIRRGGLVTSFNTFTEFSKIQNVSLTQTPYQDRNALCNLTIYTAGGNISYPYITTETGIKLRDYLLYRLESGTRKWM